MPSIIIKKNDNSIVELTSNNFAISQYSQNVQVDTYQMDEKVDAIIFNSDGLDENELEDGSMYLDQMQDDIKSTYNFSTFVNILDTKIKEYSDDSTMFYIQKNKNYEIEETHILQTKMSQIENSQLLVQPFLDSCCVPPEIEGSLLYAFNELILNAYEHGNLEIDYDNKQFLIENDTFIEECLKREKEFSHKKIILKLFCRNIDDKTKEIMIEVKDEGKGFDTHVFKRNLFEEDSFHGRGISISRSILDNIAYDSTGNTVQIKKSFKFS
jgi:hypothetical protein